MPPKLRDPSDPQEWLRRARSNLARARADLGLPDVLLEDLCFDASQAAEKALKAVLVHKGTSFPKTHSLSDLLTLAASAGAKLSGEVLEAARLTHYAVTTRYPGLAEEVTRDEYLDAVKLATRVVEWAESLIEAASRGEPNQDQR
jgi:HEPN domain-containing protein